MITWRQFYDIRDPLSRVCYRLRDAEWTISVYVNSGKATDYAKLTPIQVRKVQSLYSNEPDSIKNEIRRMLGISKEAGIESNRLVNAVVELHFENPHLVHALRYFANKVGDMPVNVDVLSSLRCELDGTGYRILMVRKYLPFTDYDSNFKKHEKMFFEYPVIKEDKAIIEKTYLKYYQTAEGPVKDECDTLSKTPEKALEYIIEDVSLWNWRDVQDMGQMFDRGDLHSSKSREYDYERLKLVVWHIGDIVPVYLKPYCDDPMEVSEEADENRNSPDMSKHEIYVRDVKINLEDMKNSLVLYRCGSSDKVFESRLDSFLSNIWFEEKTFVEKMKARTAEPVG